MVHAYSLVLQYVNYAKSPLIFSTPSYIYHLRHWYKNIDRWTVGMSAVQYVSSSKSRSSMISMVTQYANATAMSTQGTSTFQGINSIFGLKNTLFRQITVQYMFEI